MQETAENITDYEMLREAFGDGYFIFSRIKNKVPLNPLQQEELQNLVEERNHFEILHLVNSLRKTS
jgi:hypothetical protein